MDEAVQSVLPAGASEFIAWEWSLMEGLFLAEKIFLLLGTVGIVQSSSGFAD